MSDKLFILKTAVNTVDYQSSCDRIFNAINQNQSCYIIPANVHVIMTGYFNPKYQEIVNKALLVTPDGMPLVWSLKLLGIKKQTRVYGPDLMLILCEKLAQKSIPIYLYGGTETMLNKLEYNLKQKYPNLIVAGSYAPPFRPLTLQEETEDLKKIENSGAKVLFIGLGCPKQEEWMARQKDETNLVMLGVGAAFSFHSGEISQAPRWMMAIGLEWLYRFIQEPKRLAKRYIVNNPLFIILFSLQLLKGIFSLNKQD
jgi:N-acetylglucosaminyldiphosphoundecaprenol N-acetyl-beta-D-mannosaminyltransferase